MSVNAEYQAPLWTWNAYIDAYPWTDDGEGIKAWRTKDEALADGRREWGDADVTAVPIQIQYDGTSDVG